MAILLAVGSQIGAFAAFLGAALACVVAAIVFRGARGRWLGAMVVCITLAVILLPALRRPRVSATAQCTNNLKQLGLALQYYHEQNGCYPPAYIADAQGRPMHSWRTLLLPYLERSDVLQVYRFDEPWDGPNNRRLHEVWLPEFQCPTSGVNPNPNRTDYLAVVGPGTMWPGDESFKNGQVTDNPAETLLLVEVSNSDVVWCEPRDLHVNQMSPHVNPAQGQGISSYHTGRALVLMSDGRVETLYDGITPENLRALLSPDGGEAIDPRGVEQP